MFLQIHTKLNTIQILAPILYSYRTGKLATQILKSEEIKEKSVCTTSVQPLCCSAFYMNCVPNEGKTIV